LANVAQAEGTLFNVPTRTGIKTTLYWEEGVFDSVDAMFFPQRNKQ
jgi:hypothetical protein